MSEPNCTWQVPLDHPAFPGHFPGRPIVPGVVILDQAIRFAAALSQRPPGPWQVGHAKFLSPVAPGETIVFTLQAKANGSIAFTAHSAGRDVASGSLTPLAA